jgi:hypothetical protein
MNMHFQEVFKFYFLSILIFLSNRNCMIIQQHFILRYWEIHNNKNILSYGWSGMFCFCFGSSLAPCRWSCVTGSCGGCVHWTPPFIVDLVFHIIFNETLMGKMQKMINRFISVKGLYFCNFI